MENRNISIQSNKVELTKQEEDNGGLMIKGTYKQKPIGDIVSIKNQDILDGHIHFDNFYDEEIFEIFQTAIAGNFCPC